MNRSRPAYERLLPELSAVQHERASQRAPRPLPLFLELLRQVSERDPELARAALIGLRAYESAPRQDRPPAKPEVARARGAVLRDHGGSGPPAVLVPSLINPPRILDLDQQVSLSLAIGRMGRRALLLDWGAAGERAGLSVAGHIEELLLPLLRGLGERVALVGYCLGGTMAIAAANLIEVERLVTLAAPWNFAAYAQPSKQALAEMWRHAAPVAKQLDALPMEILQAAFWSLDPERTVRKFADFGKLEPESAKARRFIELEEWANEGEPLPYAAAKELIEDLFGRDLSGSGRWRVGGTNVSDGLHVEALHLVAERDLIAPPDAAPDGDVIGIPSGHVGMIVGSVREQLHQPLAGFLTR